MSTEDTTTHLPEHGYWKSIAELEGKAIYQTDDGEREGDEFPASAENAGSDPLSRRNFFQLMGSSMALAGVAGAGCKRYEKEEIVPLSRRPEDQIPGTTTLYSTAFELGGVGHALVAHSYEGRPIKVDGNPEHPFAGGGTNPETIKRKLRHAGSSAYAQAAVLGLYDPDRSQAVLEKGKPSTFEAFTRWLAGARAQLGNRLRVLSEATSSPTVAALKSQLPPNIWHEWEPLSWDNQRAGMVLAFGSVVRPLALLDKAQTIVALDCDLFVEHPAALRYNRDYARSRRPEGGTLDPGDINRLWAIESVYTGTGAIADHRLPLRSELILPFLMAVDAQLGGGGRPSAKFLEEGKVPKFLTALVDDLQKRNSVLIAGRRQPAAVHALVAKINETIQARAKGTLTYLDDPDPVRPTHVESLTQLVNAINAKQVDTLIILGGNPVYDAPADLKLGAALAQVATSIHLSEYANETSHAATWHVPRAHFLEAWGDTRTWDGVITLAQPLIMPMYGGISTAEMLALVLGDARTGDRLIRATYETYGVQFDWKKAVHDGFIPNTALGAPATLTLQAVPPVNLTQTQLGTHRLKNGELEVTFAPSTQTYDGRFANNGWLQELPDFLTKVTWDNHALVSPATAKELGLENDHLIKLEVNGATLHVPCYVMPGQARFSIGVILGGGRTRAGKVGGLPNKKVGTDTYQLRTTAGLDIASGAKVTGTGTEYWLANVQEHWDIRKGLDKTIGAREMGKRVPELVKHTDLASYPTYKAKQTLDYFPEMSRGLSLAEEHAYPGVAQPPQSQAVDRPQHAWAMATDMNACTGCNACVIACQAENNIPVVGKEQVFKNREMHWIRIDRYFLGPVDDPEVSHQPLTCQQCENAPCEQVCPVGATTHSNEGLNDMAYNRCIGTRYCLNNCPYRVRRFNFFDYHKEFADARTKVKKLLFNPEVTVRARGVMEKCTFCVQRIQNRKIAAKAAGVPLADGDIVTACQAACPAEAIVFGDLADPQSRVTLLHKEKRAYGMLDDLLYTRPRNKYLARIKNPHPLLAGDKPAPAHGSHP